MATIYGDESADGKAERVFAVAAIIGTDRQWAEFVPAWNDITDGQEFHAAEWEREFVHDPDQNRHDNRQKSYRKLTELLAWSGMHGRGVGVDLAGYRAAFPFVTSDMAYHKCFVEVADRMIRDALGLCYRDIKFVFDNRQGSGTTSIVYEWLSRQAEWTERLFLADELSFDNRENPCIQAADLLARETMKALDNKIGSRLRPFRKSFMTLASSARHFQFDFLMAEYFADMKVRMSSLEERVGFGKAEYLKWLKHEGAQDTLSTRHRFLIWFEANTIRKK